MEAGIHHPSIVIEEQNVASVKLPTLMEKNTSLVVDLKPTVKTTVLLTSVRSSEYSCSRKGSAGFRHLAIKHT